MMSSLRSRQLIGNFVIFFIGIAVLGMWLSSTIHNRESDIIAKELEGTSLDLLGYIEYNGSKMEVNSSEFEVFLNVRKLRQKGKERFAYIWDASQQKIIWDSVDSSNVDQQAINNNFTLFNFETVLQQIDAQGQGFSPAIARKVYSIPQDGEEKPVQYMVAAQKFSIKIGGAKRDYLSIVATSIADIEESSYALLKTFTTWFLVVTGLFLLAQFAFSLWVVAPIRRFEKEVSALGNGTKAAIENEYPNELTSIKNTINALVYDRKGQK